MNKDHPIPQILQTSQQCLLDYQKENKVRRTQMDTPAPTRVSRHPPPDGSVKINFDGATFKDINKVGIGIVNQDGFGQVLASLLEQIQLPYSSDLVEAMLAARAIYFAAELGFSSYVLEGDSKLIIKALKNENDSLSCSQNLNRCQLYFIFPRL